MAMPSSTPMISLGWAECLTDQLAALEAKEISERGTGRSLPVLHDRRAQHAAQRDRHRRPRLGTAGGHRSRAGVGPGRGGDKSAALHGLLITEGRAAVAGRETAGMRTVCGRPGLGRIGAPFTRTPRPSPACAGQGPSSLVRPTCRLRQRRRTRPGNPARLSSNNPLGERSLKYLRRFGRRRCPRVYRGRPRRASTYGSEISGGSTRIPSHFEGLYGHKSTWQSGSAGRPHPFGGPGDLPGRWG